MLKWKDPRLHFNFLKENGAQNIIKVDTEKHIWTPTIKFLTLKDLETNNELSARLTVNREGPPAMSAGLEFRHPNETYKGSQNSILMRRVHQAVFICSFDNINDYHFDDL